MLFGVVTCRRQHSVCPKKYSKFLISGNAETLQKIGIQKETVLFHLAKLNQSSAHSDAMSVETRTNITTLVQSLFKFGDAAVGLQAQVISGIEQMEEIENTLIKTSTRLVTSSQTCLNNQM